MAGPLWDSYISLETVHVRCYVVLANNTVTHFALAVCVFLSLTIRTICFASTKCSSASCTSH